jgi:SAM-dependent methyltransferase
MTPDWQLPPGTDRGLWDYVTSERVAREYDAALAGSSLLETDLRFAERYFPVPGRLIDLGCGTGRLLMHFAARKYACLGVDLSEAMLAQVNAKAAQAGLAVAVLKANLVELDMLPAATFDYAACLFSTLGMIRGAENRRRFLGHVRRILKPGAVFVLHAHNARYRLGRGRVDRADPGVMALGPVHLPMQQSGRVDVLEVLRAAGDVPEGVEALDGGADDLHRRPAASRIALMMLS